MNATKTLREEPVKVPQDSRLKIGDHIIVDTETVKLEDGGQASYGVTPYMAEITGWGTHWSEPWCGRAGYYALTRELPDGERLVQEWIARKERGQ